jgi:uncharacterized membrane protein
MGRETFLGFWAGLLSNAESKPEELLLAMNATLGGPPTAAAMPISAGWPKLVLPGLLIGFWGYVIGTPAGVMVVEWFKR